MPHEILEVVVQSEPITKQAQDSNVTRQHISANVWSHVMNPYTILLTVYLLICAALIHSALN